MRSEHDTLETRPSLTRAIAPHNFASFYWLKEELITFCRANKLRTTGAKIELTQRIENFLLSGDTQAQEKKPPRVLRQTAQEVQAPLSADTRIPEDYTSSQEHRAFFVSVIGPRFHFTTRFMQFCKENAGKTYQDAIDEWYREEQQKRDPAYKTRIAPQFEYNQHIRNFMQAHPDKPLKDAIAVWNEQKKRRKES